jgi:hypothetical protein
VGSTQTQITIQQLPKKGCCFKKTLNRRRNLQEDEVQSKRKALKGKGEKRVFSCRTKQANGLI